MISRPGADLLGFWTNGMCFFKPGHTSQMVDSYPTQEKIKLVIYVKYFFNLE